ncbi:hypothetical protein GCM10008170_24480 [Methylopila capsulata]|nr:hypothetical protein GCM10008170_24480 [Methylopila capsulata]
MGVLRRLARLVTPAMLIAALPLALAMTAAAGLSWRYNQAVRDQRDLVVHTYRVLLAIDRLLSVLQDAETGQRGYVITGDRGYLRPYEAAVAAEPAALAALGDLVADSAEQSERLAAATRVSARKLEELARTTDLRATEGYDAARAAVATDDGKRTMDELRAIVGAMDRAERDLLARRSQETARIERAIVWIAALGAALSLAGRVAATLLVAAWRRRQLRRAGEARKAAGPHSMNEP